MKRSFLFVGAKPARTSARRCADRRRRQQDERVRPSLHLFDGTRDERAHGVGVVGRRDEVGEEARRDAVLERVADDGDADERVLPVRPEAAVVPRRVEVAPVEVPGVAREVAPVAGCGPGAQLVHVLGEPRDRAHVETCSSRSTATGARIPPCSPSRPSA